MKGKGPVAPGSTEQDTATDAGRGGQQQQDKDDECYVLMDISDPDASFVVHEKLHPKGHPSSEWCAVCRMRRCTRRGTLQVSGVLCVA